MNLVPFPLTAIDRRAAYKVLAIGLAVAFLCLVVDVLCIVKVGPNSPTLGDGPFYAGLARSLASGRGYVLERENSFWPGQPTVTRVPLWPVILSVPARIFPHANENALLRFTGAILHAISAALMVALTLQLTGSLAGAALAGGFLGIYPPASGLVVGGYSEIAFLPAMLAGVILVLEGPRARYAGAILCGVAVLARPNFILLPLMLLSLLILFRSGDIAAWRKLRLWAMFGILFLVAPSVWIVRNYLISGYFPVLAGMEGETLYGGNNARVASDLAYWGYWVMPNEIPGEKPKQELAQTRSELEVNHYYHQKAMEYIRANWFALPRLMVGKLVRGFVPVPWVPFAASYIVFFSRACVYVAFAVAWSIWRERNEAFTFAVAAMLLVILATTLVYYGSFRFTFCVEPFLFPFIVGAAVTTMRARKASLNRGCRSERLVGSY